MSCTKSSSFSPRIFFFHLVLASLAVPLDKVRSQAVPSQANVDASAQRRMQELAEESRRHQRIEDQLRLISSALEPERLSGSAGPVLAGKALAALFRLRQEGIPPNDAILRAVRATRLSSAQTAKPAAYLRNLFADLSPKITPAQLKQWEAGENPSPAWALPPFQP